MKISTLDKTKPFTTNTDTHTKDIRLLQFYFKKSPHYRQNHRFDSLQHSSTSKITHTGQFPDTSNHTCRISEAFCDSFAYSIPRGIQVQSAHVQRTRPLLGSTPRFSLSIFNLDCHILFSSPSAKASWKFK